MARQSITQERWIQRTVTGEEYCNIDFDDCVFQAMQFSKCTFQNCRFKNCDIGFSCRFDQCKFERCKYTGMYSALQGQFNACSFIATRIQSSNMEGVVFSDCQFSGRWQTLMLNGQDLLTEPPEFAFKPSVFKNVDLSDVKMVNVDFRCGVDLSTVTLPASGVRVFRNPEGAFSKRLRASTENLGREAQICLGTLGHEMYDNQDPMVICEDLLEDFLADPEARETFDQVVSELGL